MYDLKRVAIVGISGGGKSTIANQLGKILNRTVVHLDKEHWTKDWQRRFTPDEWRTFQEKLVLADEWIIDGNYRNEIDIRLKRATFIVYVNIPKSLALFRVFKRWLFAIEHPFDKEEGTKERVSWNIIRFILNYPKKDMELQLEKVKEKVFIIKNSNDSKRFLKLIHEKAA